MTPRNTQTGQAQHTNQDGPTVTLSDESLMPDIGGFSLVGFLSSAVVGAMLFLVLTVLGHPIIGVGLLFGAVLAWAAIALVTPPDETTRGYLTLYVQARIGRRYGRLDGFDGDAE